MCAGFRERGLFNELRIYYSRASGPRRFTVTGNRSRQAARTELVYLCASAWSGCVLCREVSQRGGASYLSLDPRSDAYALNNINVVIELYPHQSYPIESLGRNQRHTMVITEALIAPAPRCPALPELPPDGFWTETQWAVYMALMDTIVPAVVSKSALTDKEGQLGIPDAQYSSVIKTAQATVLARKDEDSLRAFLEDKPSCHPEIRAVQLRIAARLPAKQRAGLGGLLSSLS